MGASFPSDDVLGVDKRKSESANRMVYTPGPWELYANTVLICHAKGNDVRAECDPHGRVCRDASWADAKLIAAAPELLEACKAFLDLDNQCGASLAFVMAKKAIQKATDSVV